MTEPRTTLIRPPPADPNKAPIENVLEVTKLNVLGPDIFTNTRQPWHPPGARGIFGGSVIAQCLAAGQKTVPDDFFVHSCHCYFLLAGSSEIPLIFHVEHVRDGRSFATRTVQARQKGRCVFTVTMSFVRKGSSGGKAVRHEHRFPAGKDGEGWEGPPTEEEVKELEKRLGIEGGKGGPFQSYRIRTVRGGSSSKGEGKEAKRDEIDKPEELKTRMWVRARGKIQGGHSSHLEALAYMSDSYFIGTVARIHSLWRWPFSPSEMGKLPPRVRVSVRRVGEFEGVNWEGEEMKDRPKLGMMVSLDHSIYFHAPEKVKADGWMLCEMQSPWAGDGRGVVEQRIWGEDGTLLATCFQEGLVRLREDAGKAAEGEEEQEKAKL